MANINDAVLDAAIQYIIDNAENIYVLSADPGLNYGNIATYKLGTKAAPLALVGTNPKDGSPNGRRVEYDAISDGVVDAAGTATHFAITDDSASRILASAPLSVNKDLAMGSPWTLTAFSITIPDAA